MSRRPVSFRGPARRDLIAALAHYRAEGGFELAASFARELRGALNFVRENPSAGSPRWGHDLDLPGLRTWPMRRFSHALFYVERGAAVEVVRILHSRRDLPGELQGAEEE